MIIFETTDNELEVTVTGGSVDDSTSTEEVQVNDVVEANIQEVLEETLGDNAQAVDDMEVLKDIQLTLHIILVVILIIWASNHLHIVARTFGKIGKGRR